MAINGRDGTNEVRDGRRLRGERTRLRVLESLLELIQEGQLHPTAQAVAERAGVALRTVYHHFEDIGALRAMALTMQTDRYRDTLRPISPDQPLEDRIRATAHQYRRLFESITPLRLAALFDQQASEDVATGLRQAREQRREQLAATFDAELQAHRGEGRPLLDALDLLVSWDTWNYLRSSLGRPPAAAERVLMLLLGDLLASSATAPAATRTTTGRRTSETARSARPPSTARRRSGGSTRGHAA